MLTDLTIENVRQIERGTNMMDDIYCMIKFVELSEEIPFYANRVSDDNFSSSMWSRLDNEEFGVPGFPPTNYPSHPATESEKSDEVRATRDNLLLKTDWTQSSEDLSATKKAEYKTYRTALRDITNQVGFPFVVTWPTSP